MGKDDTTHMDQIQTCAAAVNDDLAWVDELQALQDSHTACSAASRARLVESKKLDSSMKKNTAAIRKLKTLQEGNAAQIMADLDTVNQTKYVSEAVSAILEAPIKMKDMKAVVRVASMLYQRYEDFGTIMHERLVQLVVSPMTIARTKRLYTRLFFAFVQAGLFSKVFPSIYAIIRSWGAITFVVDSDGPNEALSMVNAFLKAGRQGLFRPVFVYPHERVVRDMASDKIQEAVACVERMDICNAKYLHLWALSESEEAKVKDKVLAYFNSAVESLKNARKLILTAKKQNESIMNARGDLSEKRIDQYKDLCDTFETFDKNVRAVATTLGQTVPEFTIPDEAGEESLARVVETTSQIADAVFDDPDDKAMYIALPCLSELVPSVLLGKQHETNQTFMLEDECRDHEEEDDEAPDVHEDQDTAHIGNDSNISLRDLVSKLPECVSIDLCDSFVVDYCYAGGSKPSSQKLVAAALSRPPFGAIQLLPYYSRIIASLSPWFPIVKEQTIVHLQREFYGLKKKVDISTSTVEPRLRNASYISELVKFGIYPPGKVFVQLRSLFDDFSRHNVDTACCIVQNCGRYLMKRPDTSERMVNMMNIMIRLKNARNLDNRQTELILACQASMYATKTNIIAKTRSPTKEYVRYLINSELNKSNVASVCSILRRIHWKQDSWYVRKKIMSAVRKGRHDQLSNIADLIENMGRYYPSFVIDIVDEVMEEILCGLEQPVTKYNQRRLSIVAFLGVMCKHNIAPNNLVEDTMHLLLSYSVDGEIQDPFFRIKLITALGMASKTTIMRSKAIKNRLIRFFTYFEEFVLMHQPMPLDLQIDIDEMYSSLKIKRNQFETQEQAIEAINKALLFEKSRKTRQDLQSIAESEEENSEEGDIESDPCEVDDSDVSIESTSSFESEFSSEDDMEIRSMGRTAEDESFERELALAMGTVSQPEASRKHIHKHISDFSPQQESHRISFNIMMKRGGRDDTSRSVHIPVSSDIAYRIEQNKEAAAAEKAALKRMVLASDF